MTSSNKIDQARSQTRAVYERRAEKFDEERTFSEAESEWLSRFAEWVPAGGRVLDLGCGTGEPISAWLIGRGYDVTGIDYSQQMLQIARKRFPASAWVLNDMRTLAVEGPFDGILSWHGSFHLTPNEQRTLIPKLTASLTPGGALMLTIGDTAGEVTGKIAGDHVYHASLSAQEYQALLEANGATIISIDTDRDDGPFVLLAKM